MKNSFLYGSQRNYGLLLTYVGYLLVVSIFSSRGQLGNLSIHLRLLCCLGHPIKHIKSSPKRLAIWLDKQKVNVLLDVGQWRPLLPTGRVRRRDQREGPAQVRSRRGICADKAARFIIYL